MKSTNTNSIEKLADHLQSAFDRHKGVSPVTEVSPSLTIKEAYEVQLATVENKTKKGSKIVGKKIGLTSKAMQESLGVDEPDYGHLFDDMVVTSDDPVLYSDQVLQPRVEGELAFILNKNLVGPNVTTDDVLNATESIVAAIEIVDSRIQDWKISLKDTVADNGSSAYYILGEQAFKADELDRIGTKMKLFKNNTLINEGTGADVLGDPAACVAWLANKLHEFDIQLKAGEVILAGALSAAIPAEMGDHFSCQFTEGLGEVHISFKER